MKENKICKILLDFLVIILGNTCIAVAVAFFVIPNKLLVGGTAGIAVALNKLWGFPEETVNEYCLLLSKAFDACNDGKPLPSADNSDLPEALKRNYQAVIAQLQTPYLSRFIAVDVRPLLPQITCPVLALNGTKDIQVDQETNLAALRNGLGDNTNNVIKEVEGVNHLFQHCKTGSVTEYKAIEETISPDILTAITDWLAGLK